MNALKLFVLIFLLSGFCQLTRAGSPAEVKIPQEQRAGTRKPVNIAGLNSLVSPARNQFVFSVPAAYRPNKPRGNSGTAFLRTNFGRVINSGHMIFTGIMEVNMRCTTYTSADKIRNPYPSPGLKEREIILVSAVSALCISGLVLTPIIKRLTGHIRYNKNARGTYAIIPDIGNGVGLIAMF